MSQPTLPGSNRPSPGQIELTAESSLVSMLAGATRPVNLTLHNRAGAPCGVDLAVRGVPGAWGSLETSFVGLGPGDSVSLVLRLSPTVDAPPGNYPLSVVAQTRDGPPASTRLAMVLEIGEPGEFSLELEPTTLEGEDQVTFGLRLAQSGPETIRVLLSAQGDETTCDYMFDRSDLVVPPEGSTTSALTVRARQGVLSGDARTHPFVVTATVVQGGAGSSKAEGRFVQRLAQPLEIDLDPPQQHGGALADFAVRVVNPSQVQTSVRFSASDPQSRCRYEFAHPELFIEPGGMGETTLSVSPLTLHQDAIETTHTFVVRAEPGSPILTKVETAGSFTQTAIQPPRLTLSPSSQTSSGAARFGLSVTNPRQTPLSVELAAHHLEQDCELTISPSSLQLAPESTTEVRVTARPAARLLEGETRRARSFTLAANTPDLRDPVTVDGVVIQVRKKRSLLWPLLLVAALLAYLAVAYWVHWFPFGTIEETVKPIPTAIPIAPPEPTPQGPPSPSPAPEEPCAMRQDANAPIPCIKAVLMPDKLGAPGQPFEIEIRALNVGQDAAGGSITLSAPDDAALTVIDASIEILPPDHTNCDVPAERAWVREPGGPCQASNCEGKVTVVDPMAELWDGSWLAGEKHIMRVLVEPPPGAQHVTLYLRVALRAPGSGCDIRNLPQSSSHKDQQGFPVYQLGLSTD